jgi:asparagine synthase (glutamine-hydrolysing)
VTALAGIWRFDEKPHPDADCARMLAAQHVYGPHDGRQWSKGTLAMGRRLFRLLPEDAYDRQPLQSRDGRLTLIADVRLDNREDLAAELGLSSGEAQQLCDAAILLESLDHWGDSALAKLVGDFAFVLWDAPGQRLLLARDFLGQRPLHYHRGRGFFAFASMPKGLHALAEIPCGPDEQMAAEWLVFIPRSGPRSFFREIARVEPAHVVTVTRDGLSSRRYWQPQGPRGNRLRSGDYVEGVRHQLDQATQARLRGVNGAVASHLSAGLDSSAVTATAARLLAPRGGKVVAFTAVPRAGYDGQESKIGFSNEGPLAAATAALYPNVEHVLVRSSAHQSPLDALDRIFYLSERPPIESFISLYHFAIDQAARERKLTVMLIGLMGNMTISYNGIELLPELLRSGSFISVWREARRLVRHTGVSPKDALIKIFGPFIPGWLWRRIERRRLGNASDVFQCTAIRADCMTERNLAAIARQRDLDFDYRPSRNGFALRLWVLNQTDLAELRKGTLAGCGVDYRDPLADKRLVEYCLSVPTDQYLFNGVPRGLARRALSDRLPQAVLNEPRQGYQAADWHEGLTAARQELAAELARLSAYAPAAKMIDLDKLKCSVEHWPSSGWGRYEVIDKYRAALVHSISAGHFLRKASGAN